MFKGHVVLKAYLARQRGRLSSEAHPSGTGPIGAQWGQFYGEPTPRSSGS